MTASDSQDGARRRDDACPIGYHGDPLGCDDRCYPTPRQRRTRPGGPLQHDGPPTAYEDRLDELKRERDEARADVARLEAERDEARAAQLRYLRELTATCSCGTSPMTYEGPEPDCAVHGAVRAFNEAAAELARMRPVYEAAVAWAEAVKNPNDPEPWDAAPRSHALIAAVDQTAPSSPQETSHTADDGEAGVVEGAGGSDAAEAMYEAAIRLLSRKADIGTNPVAWLVPTDLLRELIADIQPLAVAEGRRQAAAAIRAQIITGAKWGKPGGIPRASDLREWAAAIAEGVDDA